MRFELDGNGYVLTVLWGCNTGICIEYTGEVPAGYSSLKDWADHAWINAYYLNDYGNLTLDPARESELKAAAELQEIDNEIIRRKDLYESLEFMNSLAVQKTEKVVTGNVLQIEDGENAGTTILLTSIEPYSYEKVDIFAQGKQMLRNDATDKTISGVTFALLADGGVKITGTAEAAIEYDISGSDTNIEPICGIKKGYSYYLNIGEYDCEMQNFNGETMEQVYVGGSGVIDSIASKNITHVFLKIPAGKVCDSIIYPMLEYGEQPSQYEAYNSVHMVVDYSEYISLSVLYANDNVYPSDTLYPLGTSIDYILIQDGIKRACVLGAEYAVGLGRFNLLKGYNFFYTTQDTDIKLTYTVSAITGTFKGDVIDPTGMQITGKSGLLNTLQYVSGEYKYVGFDSERNNIDIEINTHIPVGFDIVDARLVLYFQPFYVSTDGLTGVWSNCWNLKAYKGVGKAKWITDGESLERTIEDVYEEISGAFGENGWTPPVSTDSNYSTRKKESENIKDHISSGNQMIYIRSDFTVPAAAEGSEALQAALYSGMAIAVLNIVGYKKYS